MIRLFISLYLAVIIGIGMINWTTEKIWSNVASHQLPEIKLAQSIAANIPAMVNEQQVSLVNIEQLLGMPVTQLKPSEVVWLHDNTSFKVGALPSVIYDSMGQPMIYVLDSANNTMYQVGPIALPDSEPSLKTTVRVIAYLMLGLLLFLWAWPLWSDLKKLEKISTQITDGKLVVDMPIRNVSPIAPVLQKFKSMSLHLSNLINEQKQIINSISHELRTPIARLRFATDSLSSSHERLGNEIKLDLNEMETLIDELLNYSRLDHLMLEMDKEPVDLAQLLANQIEKLQRGTEKQLQFSGPEQAIYVCNGVLIERATQNLIVNAIKYAKSKVIISLNVGEKVTIAVEDDGNGIQEEDREKVFGLFETLEKSRNKSSSGFGLGLAITNKIIKMHDGHCDVSDAQLGGARFQISLPSP